MFTVILSQASYYNVIRSTKPQSRIEQIRRSTPMTVEVIRVIEGDNRDKILKALGNPVGEWFCSEPEKVAKVISKYPGVEQSDYQQESEHTFISPMRYQERMMVTDLQEILGTRTTIFQLAIQALYDQVFPKEVDDDA